MNSSTCSRSLYCYASFLYRLKHVETRRLSRRVRLAAFLHKECGGKVQEKTKRGASLGFCRPIRLALGAGSVFLFFFKPPDCPNAGSTFFFRTRRILPTHSVTGIHGHSLKRLHSIKKLSIHHKRVHITRTLPSTAVWSRSRSRSKATQKARTTAA